ncbi:MAG: phage tail family protein [Peptostreptococcaceae bacterium]|nr:phage tail family protein [Peptostreptococcaceae bacterium]MBP3929114.1 phage tail family protein [Peptostreptococcaceae bacterium]
MSYKVNYVGVDLHEYITILNVNRPLMPPRTNFTKDIPGIHGKHYTGYKYDEKTIELECLLTTDSAEERMEIIHEIAFILDVNCPKRLIISDEPDKYCYAVPVGEIEIEKVKYNGSFTLTFVCYDPMTYALEEDFFVGENRKIQINNAGTVETYPKVSVSFYKDAHFLQCTNHKGETVLVGTPPKVDNTKVSHDPKILKDNCETLTNWNSVGNVVDNATVNGNIVINAGGWGFTCNNYGSGEGWHGGGRRRSFTPVQDFKVEVKMMHNSKGDLRGTGAGTTAASTSGSTTKAVQYKITADPSLRIRQGRGTNTKQLGTIPKGKTVSVTDIQSNWGKVTYNGKTGYIYMQYTQKVTTTTTSSTTTNNYKITANPSLRLRSGRGTKYSTLTTIKKGTTVKITDIKSNWGKVTYNGKTGYVSMQYVQKVSTAKSVAPIVDENDSTTVTAEDRLGKVEVYGFDENGAKLFKMAMSDTSEYYEYSEPEIQIGNKVVLDDNKSVPAPKTVKVKDEKDEKKTVTRKVDSGKYGDWNEFEGWFTIQRKTVSGEQEWYCEIEKIKSDGTVGKTIKTNTLVNDSYPKGKLSSVVVFFGQYGQNVVVDTMNVNEIYVTNIGKVPAAKEDKPIFKNGDELLLDFTENKVYLNGKNFMNSLDIGSQFFSVPVGNSEIICNSDDKNIDVELSLQKKWI